MDALSCFSKEELFKTLTNSNDPINKHYIDRYTKIISK